MKRTKALESAAYHEAGHAVAAWHCRVRTKSLSIIPELDSAGRHIRHPYFGGINLEIDSSPRAQRRVENMVLVCCAGPAAQRRFDPKGFRSYHAQGDWYEAINLLSYLTDDDEVLRAHFKLVDLRARKFVALPSVWSLIEDVAGALFERHQLTGKDIRAIISDSMGTVVRVHGYPVAT
jgi:ATP-dependent Zn protease